MNHRFCTSSEWASSFLGGAGGTNSSGVSRVGRLVDFTSGLPKHRSTLRPASICSRGRPCGVAPGSPGSRSLPELRNAQLDGACACLPIPVTVAVALGGLERALLAPGGAGGGTDLHLHEPLSGESDHLAQEMASRVFSTSARRFIM